MVRVVTQTSSELLGRITVEPGKCGGTPCIRGMQIRVVDVMDRVEAGLDIEEIVKGFPYLEREDVLAAILYTARLSPDGPSLI